MDVLHSLHVQDERETGNDALSSVSSIEELREWFLSRYEEQVKLCPDVSLLSRSCYAYMYI